ncbi:twin-arginine translocase subunit TatA [Acinetobacter baumannii A424]|nr:twin-arginine translocase subunit TatA [Acinetobacter baumannii A424]
MNVTRFVVVCSKQNKFCFGTSKLKNIGKDVGGAVRDFKKSVREEDEAASLNSPRTIDAQVKTSESTSVKS